VDESVLEPMMSRARQAGHEVRGISDHEFIRSIYIRDPNGYVVELTARLPGHDKAMDPAKNKARAILDRWEANRRARALGSSSELAGHG
jgi:catechol-2,3-dioxygenase